MHFRKHRTVKKDRDHISAKYQVKLLPNIFTCFFMLLNLIKIFDSLFFALSYIKCILESFKLLKKTNNDYIPHKQKLIFTFPS